MNYMEYTPEYKLDDPRLASIHSEGVHGDLILIGFPYDEGVCRNGGRRGAELGPDCLRRFFTSVGAVCNSELELSLERFAISDYGNIMIEGDSSLESNHAKLALKVRNFLKKPQKPCLFVVGGGNDMSYANSQGFLNYCQEGNFKPVILNIAAGLGVQQLTAQGTVHSGTPFRMILDSTQYAALGTKFHCFASQGSQCGKAHVDYVSSKGAQITWLRTVRTHSSPKECLSELLSTFDNSHRVFVSFNLNAINSAYCPGVSSPSVEGLSDEDALEISLLVGSNPLVVLMDVSEYSPAVEDYRTGRLLATMLYSFCLGISTYKHSINK